VTGLSPFDAAVALCERLHRAGGGQTEGPKRPGGDDQAGAQLLPHPAEEQLSPRDLPRRATMQVAHSWPRKWLTSWPPPTGHWVEAVPEGGEPGQAHHVAEEIGADS